MLFLKCTIVAFALIGAYAVGGHISECVQRYMRNEQLRKKVKSEIKRFCRREALRRKGEKLVHNACAWSDELRTILR